MKLKEAQEKILKICNIPFSELFTESDFETIIKNKGKTGQLLELALGKKLDSFNIDFEDGELKSNKCDASGKPLETVFITQIASVIDELLNEKPFEETHLYEKISNMLYVPVCKIGKPQDWMFLNAIHIDLSKPEYSEFLNIWREDYYSICRQLKEHIETSADGFIHTSNGTHIQVRSKDSKPYHPIYSNMNREKYEEIGASNLYQCYSDMEMYSFGRKYTVSDVLSDTTDDNPDPLMKFLFYITKIMNFYNNGSYGMVISLCKNKKQYFNANTFTLHNHSEKAFLKQKLEQVKSVFDNDASSVKNLLDSLQEVDVVKVDMIDDIIQKTEYSHVLDVRFKEVKKLMEYLNSSTISTQHGVKGESHTSVLFVADDSNNNPNVRMYDFFKMWSTFDFSLSEFEKTYYSYIMDIVDVETKLGTKMSNLTKETHNENELNKQNIKACCENAIKKYENNKIFEFLCKKDFLDYLNNPTVTNAKKIFKISKMEGILTAYKLFYVGCSRARKNLIIVVNGAKISKFQHDFIQKAKAIGFSVNTTLDF